MKKRICILLGGCIVGTLLGGLMFIALRYYKVTTVYVEGNIHYNNEEIMDMLDKKLTEYLKSKYLIPLGKYKGNDNLNPFYDRHMRILHRLGTVVK